MRIIEVKALDNGAHMNQTFHGVLPTGWAVVPDDLDTPNYPFGTVEVEEIDGRMTVTKWVATDVPTPKTPTPSELREEAYNTQPIIEWDGEMLTVTQAAQKWQYYAAEGNPKADTIQALISEAKQRIRDQYPDEEVNE